MGDFVGIFPRHSTASSEIATEVALLRCQWRQSEFSENEKKAVSRFFGEEKLKEGFEPQLSNTVL